MKKMLVLFLVAAVAITPAMAQPGRGYDNGGYGGGGRDNGIYDNRDKRPYNDGYYFTKRERDIQIDRINYEYDNKIRRVRSNFFMNRFRKEREIQDLEQQRRAEIRQVYAKFNDRRNRYDDNDRGGRDGRWRN